VTVLRELGEEISERRSRRGDLGGEISVDLGEEISRRGDLGEEISRGRRALRDTSIVVRYGSAIARLDSDLRGSPVRPTFYLPAS